MKILLTGASGYVGRYLAARLGGRHDVVGTYRYESAPVPGCTLKKFDLCEPEMVVPLVEEAAPDIVIHAAAMSTPDPCEDDPDTARRVNVEGTVAVAKAAADVGARLLFLSTDLVFDGKNPPYKEDDPPSPTSVYARCKVEAEQRVLELSEKSLVLRLSWCYGWKPIGRLMFCDIMRQNLAAGKGMRLFTDERRSALYLEDCAEMIARTAEMPDWGALEPRILHLAGPQSLTRMEFGEVFCDVLGFDKKLLDPTESRTLELAAPRPEDVTLDGERVWKLLDYRPRPASQGVAAMAKVLPR